MLKDAALATSRWLAFKQNSLPARHVMSFFAELTAALADGTKRVRALANTKLEVARTVGKKKLPTTVGGLLVHVADHTQRHVGQAITTKIVGGIFLVDGAAYTPMPDPKRL